MRSMLSTLPIVIGLPPIKLSNSFLSEYNNRDEGDWKMARGSQFTEEFKREAVRKAEASQNLSRTARELGISNKTLHQ